MVKSTKSVKSVKSSKSSKSIAKSNNKAPEKVKKNNRLLEVKTTQTGAFKQVIERISNVISDCSIVFIPGDDTVDDDDYYEEFAEEEDVEIEEEAEEEEVVTKSKRGRKSKAKKQQKPLENIKKSAVNKTIKKNTGGIRILRLTEEKNILVKLNLDASNFEYFHCDEPKITIGVDMHSFYGHIKMINDDDPIILYMNRDNRSSLYIKSVNENSENRSSEETDIELFLMEIPNQEMPIPQTEFQNKITMASDKFHSICKHLNNNSTFVEITSVKNEILFRGQNEGGKATMSYKDINYHNRKKDKTDQVVQGIYELRNLMGFSKCNKLCNTIEIYLKNDFPLVLVIHVASLGKMYVFFSPIENGEN